MISTRFRSNCFTTDRICNYELQYVMLISSVPSPITSVCSLGRFDLNARLAHIQYSRKRHIRWIQKPIGRCIHYPMTICSTLSGLLLFLLLLPLILLLAPFFDYVCPLLQIHMNMMNR